MSAPAARWQQAVPAGIVLALALWVAWVSFNVANAGPYLFPRLISLFMLALAAIAFLRAVRGRNRTGEGLPASTAMNIAPGIAAMLAYVFLLAEWLGFYVASALVFFAIFTWYDPAPHVPRVWARRLAVTAGFMLVLYLVFATGLRVQTPRGLFF